MCQGYTNWKDVSGELLNHKHSHVRKHSIVVVPESMGNVSELLLSEVKKKYERNCAYLQRVLQDVMFLARQCLPF